MGKLAYIFPGQGAQKAGMGKDFYENSAESRAVFDRAQELLGLDMKALCFEENDKLDITEYTQAAMVTVSLAILAEMEDSEIARQKAGCDGRTFSGRIRGDGGRRRYERGGRHLDGPSERNPHAGGSSSGKGRHGGDPGHESRGDRSGPFRNGGCTDRQLQLSRTDCDFRKDRGGGGSL